jgi:hypothetical protein
MVITLITTYNNMEPVILNEQLDKIKKKQKLIIQITYSKLIIHVN